MRIAVVGYGAAGAASALLLSRQGHEVTLFEKAPELKPVGAGVLLQPSGQMALSAMGLLEAVVARAEPIERLTAFQASGELLDDLAATSVQFHLGVRVERAQRRGDTVTLWDQQNTDLGTFDFVLACDGLNSVLRKQSGIPTWGFQYRHGALWAIGLCEAVRRKLHQNTVGARMLYGLLPMGEGRCSLFISMHEREFPVWKQQSLVDWKKNVLQVCPLAEELLAGLTHHDDLRFTTYRHVLMQTWFRDRVLFMGDAAHAMSPHTGQGINLALLDAVVFAQALWEFPDFEKASAVYSCRRAAHIRFYAWLTLSLAPFFQSDLPLLGWGRDHTLPILQKIPPIRRQMVLAMSGLKAGFLSGRLKAFP